MLMYVCFPVARILIEFGKLLDKVANENRLRTGQYKGPKPQLAD